MDVHSHLSTEEQKSDAEMISASCASYISHSPHTPSLSESHQTLVSAVSVHQGKKLLNQMCNQLQWTSKLSCWTCN